MRKSPYTYDVGYIFTAWYAAMCHFAFMHVHEKEASEDVVRDVFGHLLEKKPVFESEQHLKNFMYLMVRNKCLNQLRQRLSHKRYVEYMRHQGEAEESNCQMIEAEIFAEVRKAVSLLPTECRKVFELCYFREMDNESAARVLNVSVETIKAQKKRGKKLLRAKLKDLYPFVTLLLSL